MRKGLSAAGILVLGALAVGACTTTGPSAADASDQAVLTRDQLDRVNFLNAYDAIRRLKPIWLRSERGQDSFVRQGQRGLRVYVDGLLYGDKETLRTLQVQTIEEIRFLDKRQATLAFGTDHGEGVLLILTRGR